MSLDGYIAGPNGEMDWLTFDWDDGLKAYITDLTESIDCILLGRNLAQGFIPHWASVAKNPDHEEHIAGVTFTETPKVVFSKTLAEYGGATFVSHLIQHGLIDEYHLCVNPVAIGDGLPIFQELESKQNLQLVKAIPFDCGIVVLNYALKQD